MITSFNFIGKEKGQLGETVEIECPKNYFIEIRKVNHRQSSCCSEASKVVLTAMCRNKSTCSFKVLQETFGGHCQNNVGSVIVKYRCVKKLSQMGDC